MTPASPHLLYGLIDEDADVALDSTPPLLGVAEEVGQGLVAPSVCADMALDSTPPLLSIAEEVGWGVGVSSACNEVALNSMLLLRASLGRRVGVWWQLA